MALLRPLETEAEDEAPYRKLLADQKAETRRRILDSARQVFLRVGFLNANLNEIARLAGVGKGTLYRHFPSKGELYVAMLAEQAAERADELVGAVDPEAGTLCQLEQVACFPIEFWRRHPDHYQLVWVTQNLDLVGPLSPELVAEVREILEAPVRMLAELIRRGVARGELRPVDPWETANLLALCINAVVGPMVTRSSVVFDHDPAAVHRRLLDVVRAGLAQSGAAPAEDPT